jgi:hypothetical protein
MKLFIDDIRDAPDNSWVLVRTISEAIRFIARYGNEIRTISLDHDISIPVNVDDTYRPFPSKETYQPVAYFIRHFYYENYVPNIIVHSSNTVGANEIKNIFDEHLIAIDLQPMGMATRNN